METKCKICRKIGQKLFLRGERCFSAKCAMIKKPYNPGVRGKRKGKRRSASLSEYGLQLREKQKLKEIYGLRERQFKRYVRESIKAREEGKGFADFLIRKLELRLDNVVFRLGFCGSRSAGRQLVSHGHFLVNNSRINSPSFSLKPGDIIKIKPTSLQKTLFKDLETKLKKYKPPSWISLDKEKLEGKILSIPTKEEVNLPVNLQIVGEFYSR